MSRKKTKYLWPCLMLASLIFLSAVSLMRGDVNDKTHFDAEKRNLYVVSSGIQINLQDALGSACGDLYLPLVSAKHDFSRLPGHIAAFNSIYRKYDERFDPFEEKVEAAFADYEVFFERHTKGEPLTETERTYLTDLAAACKGLCGAMVREDGTYRKEIKKQSYMLGVLETFCDALPEAPANAEESGKLSETPATSYPTGIPEADPKLHNSLSYSNPNQYVYTPSAATVDDVEGAACCLLEQYLQYYYEKHDHMGFVLLEHRNMELTIMTSHEYDELQKKNGAYGFGPGEVGEQIWIVDMTHLELRYEGVLSPVGPSVPEILDSNGWLPYSHAVKDLFHLERRGDTYVLFSKDNAEAELYYQAVG